MIENTLWWGGRRLWPITVWPITIWPNIMVKHHMAERHIAKLTQNTAFASLSPTNTRCDLEIRVV